MRKEIPIVISEQKLRKLIAVLIFTIIFSFLELCLILFLVFGQIKQCSEFGMVDTQEEVITSSITFDSSFCETIFYDIPPVFGSKRELSYSLLNKSPSVEEEDFKYLAATIYLEASPVASLDDAVAVGMVIDNRLRTKSIWHCETYKEVVTMKEPVQFAVTLLDDYEDIVENILEMDTARAKNAVEAAKLVVSSKNIINMPRYIQFFYGDGDLRVWDSKSYYATYGGNSFFYNDYVYRVCCE